jgi:ppGpp synthetase/RelA/SpoT-type nucleotidyltranferase
VALSGNQVDRLSERLRDSPTPTEEDLLLLQEYLLDGDAALQEVVTELNRLGEELTTRMKTSSTIIDKLRRESPITLRGIRDLAGARIVKPMTLDAQDALASRIREVWPDARLIDRRADPSHGYRAVHLLPRIGRWTVQIQLRTHFQDTWAQSMELWGDRWGRDV